MLLLEVQANHASTLRRAPDVRQACAEAYGVQEHAYVISLQELLGVIDIGHASIEPMPS